MKVKFREENGAKYILIPKFIRDEMNLDKYVELKFNSEKLEITITKFNKEKIKDVV